MVILLPTKELGATSRDSASGHRVAALMGQGEVELCTRVASQVQAHGQISVLLQANSVRKSLPSEEGLPAKGCRTSRGADEPAGTPNDSLDPRPSRGSRSASLLRLARNELTFLMQGKNGRHRLSGVADGAAERTGRRAEAS